MGMQLPKNTGSQDLFAGDGLVQHSQINTSSLRALMISGYFLSPQCTSSSIPHVM